MQSPDRVGNILSSLGGYEVSSVLEAGRQVVVSLWGRSQKYPGYKPSFPIYLRGLTLPITHHSPLLSGRDFFLDFMSGNANEKNRRANPRCLRDPPDS